MTSLFRTLPLLLAFAATPALAAEPPAQTTGPNPMDMESMTPAQMHEHCKKVMGHKMEGRRPHQHSAEKLGHVPPPPTPPSEAEMKKMHEKCEAMMAEKPQGAAPPAATNEQRK